MFRIPPIFPKNNLNYEYNYMSGQTSTVYGIADQKKYSANISLADLGIIIEKYGDQIEDIYELNAGQQWMIQTRKNNKSAFFLQMTLKAEMNLDPNRFQEKVDEVCKRREFLRFAYVSKNVQKPYCVCLKNRRAEVSFIDCSVFPDEIADEKIAMLSEADRKRGFDLEKDPLLRICICKLNLENNYSIIISQPHINSDGTSLGILIKDIFIDYVLHIVPPQTKKEVNEFKKIADFLQQIDIKKELEYWSNYLSGAPEDIDLPGALKSDKEYEDRVYVSMLPSELSEGLKKAQQKYKTTTYNIMQAAWSIMLNRITGKNDILFGAITSGRDVQLLESMSVPGGFVKALPVRVKLSDNMYVGELISSLQKEFSNSMQYSHCSLDQIKDVLGRKEKLFNHILNCHNFAGNNGMSGDFKGLPGFKIVEGKIYDNLAEDLAIYIRTSQEGMSLGIGYNANIFTQETVQLYAETYQKVLFQIVNAQEDITVGQIEKIDPGMFDYTAKLSQCRNLKKTMLMSKHRIFKGTQWDDLMKIAEESRLESYLAGDVILREKDILDAVLVVISGNVIVFASTRSGWENPLKFCKPGAVLSVAEMAKKRYAGVKAVADSDQVVILRIPAGEFYEIVRINPHIISNVLGELQDECLNYQKMWLNI